MKNPKLLFVLSILIIVLMVLVFRLQNSLSNHEHQLINISDSLKNAGCLACDLPETEIRIPDAVKWITRLDPDLSGSNGWLDKNTINSLLAANDNYIPDGIYLKEAYDSKDIYLAWPSYPNNHFDAQKVYRIDRTTSCVCPPCCNEPQRHEVSSGSPQASGTEAESERMISSTDQGQFNTPIWISRTALENILAVPHATGAYLKEARKEMKIGTALVWTSLPPNDTPLVYEILPRDSKWNP